MAEASGALTLKEHKERHVLLHSMLDELVADWITVTEKRPSQGTILDLMKWSAEQIENPTEKNETTQKEPGLECPYCKHKSVTIFFEEDRPIKASCYRCEKGWKI